MLVSQARSPGTAQSHRVEPQSHPHLPPATTTPYVLPRADLTPIQSEFATSGDAAAHDAWFRAKVEQAMASTDTKIPHDQVMAEARRIIDRHRTT
jgi:hypothetical protein